MNEEGKAFVADVMKRLGVTTGPALAKAIYGPHVTLSQQRRVSAWIAGDGAPTMSGTIALLRAAGMLREDGGAVPIAAPSDPVLHRLGALEAKVDDQGEQMTKALRSLAGEVRKLGRQLEQRAPAATSKRAAR